MNTIEKQIATTFAPAILDEIKVRLDELKGIISSKNWIRMHDALRARYRTLDRGVEEDLSLQHVSSLPPAKVHKLAGKPRMANWIQILRKESDGKIWLDGWRRPEYSRKSHIRKMLKEPKLLFDPAKVDKEKRGKVKKTPNAPKAIIGEQPTPSVV